MSDEPPVPAWCRECREQMRTELGHLERRVVVLETTIGPTTDEGIRAQMVVLFDKIDAMNKTLEALLLSQAQAVGAMKGANWLGGILWAVFGGAIAAAATHFLQHKP
jgi:hypothetical protein